jgi:hypothetical protein
MRGIYDSKEQRDRVDFACRVILSGAETTRNFDGCFENDDNRQVAAHVYRRALKNPKLMAALPRYLDVELCQRDYEKFYGTAAGQPA